MTTIVAVQRKGDVEFASDSQVSFGWRKSPDSFVKVFANNGVVFGAAGSVRVANIVQHMDVPAPPTGLKPSQVESWVVNTLVPALANELEERKASRVSDNEASSESSLLVAVAGRCFEISSDFAVTREGSGLYAVGSGSDYALGALAAGASPLEAVKIAARFDMGTGGKVMATTHSALVAKGPMA